MRILVAGAGAVGGYFGAKWIAAGRDVTFLVREKRRQALANGLAVHGRSELRVPARAVLAAELRETFDAVFLTVSGGGLARAVQDIAPAIDARSLIFSALNGVRHFDVLRAAFGAERVLGSTVKCATKLDADGGIIELAPIAQIALGDWDGRNARLAALRDGLATEEVEVRISAQIREEIWEKWLMMIAMGAANSLLDGNVGAINATARGAFVIQAILQEARRALEEIRMAPRAAAVEQLQRMLGDAESAQTSSLYRNMKAGNAIELEPILGDLLDRVADERNFPLLAAAYARLAIYERARSG